MSLEALDCAFCWIESVVVGWHQLISNSFGLEMCFECCGTFVVHEMEVDVDASCCYSVVEMLYSID